MGDESVPQDVYRESRHFWTKLPVMMAAMTLLSAAGCGMQDDDEEWEAARVSAKSSSLASRAAEPRLTNTQATDLCLSAMEQEWRPDGDAVWENGRNDRGKSTGPLGAVVWPDYTVLDAEFDHGAQGHMVSAELTIAWEWESDDEYAFVMCDFDLSEVTSATLHPLIGPPTTTSR